jgi:hypothetical protein
MRRGSERDYGMKLLLMVVIVACLSIPACSTQQRQSKDDMNEATSDPFNDPFFTQPSMLDEAVLQPSDVLTEKPEEPEQPKSVLERSEDVMMSTLVVGASLAQMMAIPFLF